MIKNHNADDIAMAAPSQTIRAGAGVLSFRWEWMAYALLALVIFALRLAELDTVPPRTGEVTGLLAAWNAEPSPSPLTFWAQRIGFGLMGGTELAGRLFTALAGAVVVFMPLAFRRELGAGRAFLLSLLLGVMPPLFIASRTSEGIVWALLVGAVMLRLALSAYQTGSRGLWSAALVALVVLVLLTDPTGPLLAVMLIISGITAANWAQAAAAEDLDPDLDDPAPRHADQLGAQLRALPWDSGLAIGALVVVVTSTLFFTFPNGFGNVGQLLAGTVGLFTSNLPDNPLVAALFQMPVTVILAVAGLWVVARSGWSLVDRFWAVWLSLGVLVTLLLPGLSNAAAVLIGVPLCGLAASALAAAFYTDPRQSIWVQVEADRGDELASLSLPAAGRWILAPVLFALLLMLSVHVQTLTREVIQVSDGTVFGLISRIQTRTVNPDVNVALLWTFIGSMFVIVGFFLAATIWGNRTSLQGYALGALAFLVVMQVSAGWYVSVFNADDPVEAWDDPVTGRGYALLDQTLADLRLRETLSFSYLPITVVRDPATGVAEDGLLGWLLKDDRVTFVDSLEAARTAPIVIVSDSYFEETLEPDLGGSYVGQRFVLARSWTPASLLNADVLAWWFQRRARAQPFASQSVTLWLRQDVFEGVPLGGTLLE